MPDWEARAEESKQFQIEQARTHGDDLTAKQMEPDLPLRFFGITGTVGWSSKNLLLTYRAEFPRRVAAKKGKPSKMHVVESKVPELVKVTKQTCQPTAN